MIDFPTFQAGPDGSCVSCSSPALGIYKQVSRYAFLRYVRRRFLLWSPAPDIRVYPLPCGCCIWVHKDGSRFVTSLPY